MAEVALSRQKHRLDLKAFPFRATIFSVEKPLGFEHRRDRPSFGGGRARMP
jgi:hypothetical protein